MVIPDYREVFDTWALLGPNTTDEHYVTESFPSVVWLEIRPKYSSDKGHSVHSNEHGLVYSEQVRVWRSLAYSPLYTAQHTHGDERRSIR